jgi:hypothetical protein
MILRLTIAAIAAAVPIAITVFGWYGVHRLADVLAHFAAGVAIGAVVGVVAGLAGVLAVTMAVALAWEWVEPRLQTHFGPLRVGYEDTVGDVLAVVLGATLIMIAL